MKEAIKAIVFDFRNKGWSVQKVEQELKFSNGSIGKAISGKAGLSDFRYSKLLEFHQKEIGTPVTVTQELADKIAENNKPDNKKKIQAQREGLIPEKRINPGLQYERADIPPMPRKEEFKDYLDFSIAKSEWKSKYNQ